MLERSGKRTETGGEHLCTWFLWIERMWKNWSGAGQKKEVWHLSSLIETWPLKPLLGGFMSFLLSSRTVWLPELQDLSVDISDCFPVNLIRACFSAWWIVMTVNSHLLLAFQRSVINIIIGTIPFILVSVWTVPPIGVFFIHNLLHSQFGCVLCCIGTPDWW